MSFWSLLGTLGTAAGGYALAQNIGSTGDQAADDMGALASQLQNDSAFKGYGVTSGLGSSTVGTDGSTTLGVGPDAAMQAQGQAAYGNGMTNMGTAASMLSQGATNANAGQANNMMGAGYDQMAGAFGNIPGREQEIYNRAMAMQQPGLDANRAQTNAQEFAAGRGGVMGSQFGGSGEDAAMARAQAQAQNQASFQAMGQAQQEAMNQVAAGNQMFGAGAGYNQAGLGNAQLMQGAGGALGNLGGQQAGMGLQGYQTSFLPMEQQMKLMGLSQNNANMAQTGQLSGAGYAAQLGLGGIQAQINAQKAASELYGNLFSSTMNNAGQIGEDLGGLWDTIVSKF